jgi:DNA mismatch repair protein MutS
VLFYRMGDFYELFFDDAVKAAAALDITLTHRGKHDGADIPMCGVPVHASETYLSRLIRKGFRVAVCEQTEDPAAARKRGAKSVVAREVIRIITPGTITEDALLESRQHNYLAALADVGGDLGLAWLELSTGEFNVQPVTATALAAALARLDPGEFLVGERLLQNTDLFGVFAQWKQVITPAPPGARDSEAARRRLAEIYKVQVLDGFGDFSRPEIAACGALVDYVELTQKGRLPLLAPPRRMTGASTLEIDAATRRNLEITRTLSGTREGSLLAVIDRTVTGAGGRLIAARLAAPLTDPAAISERAGGVAYFVDDGGVREDVRTALGRCPDVERALSRITLERGTPRDLAAIGDGLHQAALLRARLEGDGAALPAALAAAVQGLGFHAELVERLSRALAPEPPPTARDGGFIAAGYSAPLDELRLLRDESRRLIANLQQRYAEDTGVATLKIRHNNVIGYFIEVTPTHADKVAVGEDGPFIHRQTLASAVRFTTVDLGELETRIGRAADRALALELELFADLAGEVVARAEGIAAAARALAELDVAAALAQLAVERRYVRPVVDDSTAFEIAGGRHPVVEAALEGANQAAFVPNDCDLATEGRLWLVTGPNMAGKSTFLRQNALIAILAQMGSFVPAEAVRLGVVDRIFSRVGAADDLARGRSTFMVEMVETAAILNQAGPRALVILDEIGRGTATYDGLSIAWASLEHLHEENRCRTLFATHFHELTQLAARLAALRCHTMRVKEWQGDLVFLHEVIPGAADRSYGIHVGRLAGLPGPVLDRAEEVLHTLEQGEQGGAITRLAADLPLFQAAPATRARAAGPSAVEAALDEIDPDALTPKGALELLYRLKTLSGD